MQVAAAARPTLAQHRDVDTAVHVTAPSNAGVSGGTEVESKEICSQLVCITTCIDANAWAWRP